MSSWVKFNDDASGMDYYHNPTSGETRWDKPEDFVESPMESNAWVTFFDEDQQKYYYYNSVTEETTWEMPLVLQSNEEIKSVESASEWIKDIDESTGKCVYINIVTGESKWVNPDSVEDSNENEQLDASDTVSVEGLEPEVDTSKVVEVEIETSEVVEAVKPSEETSIQPDIEDNSSKNPFGDDDDNQTSIAPCGVSEPVNEAPQLPTAAKAMSIAPAAVRMSVLRHNSATQHGASSGAKIAPIAYGFIDPTETTSSGAVVVSNEKDKEEIKNVPPQPAVKSVQPVANKPDGGKPVVATSNPFGDEEEEHPIVVPVQTKPTAVPSKPSVAAKPAPVAVTVKPIAAAKSAAVVVTKSTPVPVKPSAVSSNPFGDDEEDFPPGKGPAEPPALTKTTKMMIPKPPLKSTPSSQSSNPFAEDSGTYARPPTKNPFGEDKGTYARPPANPFGPPDSQQSSHTNNNNSNNNNNGKKFMDTIKPTAKTLKGSPLINNNTVPPPAGPPPTYAISAVAVNSKRGTPSPSQLLAANGGTSSSSVEEVGSMSNNMKLLIKIGVKPVVADSALRDNGNNWIASLQSINQQLVIAIRADPYNTQLSMWGARINVRIKSWLPNIVEQNRPDYHTGYVVVVNYISIYANKNIHPWQLILRYSTFYKLYCIVNKYQKYTRIKAEFPVATGGHWMWGVTDEIRNERMNKFDTWMKELLVNPILMTTKEVFEHVNVMLEINDRVTE